MNKLRIDAVKAMYFTVDIESLLDIVVKGVNLWTTIESIPIIGIKTKDNNMS